MSLTRLAGFTHETGICNHLCQRRNAVKPLASRLLAAGRTFGPYLAIELVMPGGSLLALLLWLYRMSPAQASKSPA
jgi:hypothetical protein